MRKCTCVRCQAKDYVWGIFPDMEDSRVMLIAEKIVKALRKSLKETEPHFESPQETAHD